MTAFAGITGAFIDVLRTDPPVSANIFRARDRDVPEQCSDAVNVRFESASPNPGAIHGAPVDWITRIAVECYARSATQSGDLAVDPLFAAVYARLAADPTLGGVVDDVGTPSIVAETDSLGQKTGWVQLTYSVLHRTDNLTIA